MSSFLPPFSLLLVSLILTKTFLWFQIKPPNAKILLFIEPTDILWSYEENGQHQIFVMIWNKDLLFDRAIILQFLKKFNILGIFLFRADHDIIQFYVDDFRGLNFFPVASWICSKFQSRPCIKALIRYKPVLKISW